MDNQIVDLPHFDIKSHISSLIENESVMLYGQRNSEGKFVGPCRLVLPDYQILEGIFDNNYSKKSVLWEIYGGWIEGSSVGKFIRGRSEIYSFKGESLYSGGVIDNLRHGLGNEYFAYDFDHFLSGEWVRGKKHGHFKEVFDENHQQILEGQYIDGKKQGDFYLHDKGEVYLMKYKNGNLLTQQSTDEKTTAPVPSYNIIRYSYILNSTQIENSKNMRLMMDTSMVSMWSNFLMQSLQKYKKEYKIYIFGTDLIENYVGINFEFINYNNIWHKTKHLQNAFSLVSGFFEVIMWPVCHGCHFILGVVRTKMIQNIPSFIFYYYDSLYGKGDKLFKAIKSYLLKQLQYKYHYDKSKIRWRIQNMKKIVVNVPKQSDGVSCGVFISKFMFEICENKTIIDIPGTFTFSEIQQFRKKMIDDIKSMKNPFKSSAKQQQTPTFISYDDILNLNDLQQCLPSLQQQSYTQDKSYKQQQQNTDHDQSQSQQSQTDDIMMLENGQQITDTEETVYQSFQSLKYQQNLILMQQHQKMIFALTQIESSRRIAKRRLENHKYEFPLQINQIHKKYHRLRNPNSNDGNNQQSQQQ